MKILVNVEEMKKAIKELNKVKGVNIHIEALDNKINIFTNNLVYTQLKKTLEGNIAEEGSTNFSNNIGKMMTKFKENELIIQDNNITCKNKKLEFVPEKFQAMENGKLKNEYTIEASELLRLLEVDYCTAKDETRPVLQGICFKNNQICALDGYRLSLRTSEKINFKNEFVVHSDSIKILKSLLNPKSLEQVKIFLFENHVIFNFSNYELTCKLLEGHFINFKPLIPNDVMANKIKINNVKYFKESLSMAKEAYMDKNKRPIIKLLCDDNKLKIENMDKNIKYSDIIEKSEYISHCDMIAFNINYIEAILKNNDYENLTMHFANGVSPAVISENFDMDNLELVMPIRL